MKQLPQLEPPAFDLTAQPTPAPETEGEAKTDTAKLIEIFSVYNTAEDAKAHINDVATGKNKFNQPFSKPLCYKAINKKIRFKGDAGKIESHEATAHFGEGNEMPIEQEQKATAEAPEVTEPPSYGEAPPGQFGSYEAVKAELTPIQERSVKGIVDNVFSIAGLKGDGKGEGTPFLTDQESKDTVTLLPYVLKRAIKADMTQDNFELLTIGMHVGNLATKAAKVRIEKGKMFKEEKPEAAQEIPPVGLPEPEATTEQPTPEQTEVLAALKEKTLTIAEQTTAFKKRMS